MGLLGWTALEMCCSGRHFAGDGGLYGCACRHLVLQEWRQHGTVDFLFLLVVEVLFVLPTDAVLVKVLGARA